VSAQDIVDAVTAVADDYTRANNSLTSPTFVSLLQQRVWDLARAAHFMDDTDGRTLVQSVLEDIAAADRQVNSDDATDSHTLCCALEGCDPDNLFPTEGQAAGCAGVGHCERCVALRQEHRDRVVFEGLADLGRAVGRSEGETVEWLSRTPVAV
jgi:hypothetical protein